MKVVENVIIAKEFNPDTGEIITKKWYCRTPELAKEYAEKLSKSGVFYIKD